MRYEFGNVSLDMDARLLRRGERVLHLSPKALELLSILITERSRVVPRQELYDRLWPATFVVEANLPVLIREIRRAIGDDKRSTIRTVHGTGYSFAAPVQEAVVARARNAPRSFVHMFLHGTRECPLGEGDNLVGREPTAEVFLNLAPHSARRASVPANRRGFALHSPCSTAQPDPASHSETWAASGSAAPSALAYRGPLPAFHLSETLGTLRAVLQDRYAVERELGRGGMATVYLARAARDPHGRAARAPASASRLRLRRGRRAPGSLKACE